MGENILAMSGGAWALPGHSRQAKKIRNRLWCVEIMSVEDL
jgi:hypothetical protein